MSDAARFWEEQAPGFDDAPDHGLRDETIRSAWASLLTPLMPPAPARIADVGCGTGSVAVLLAQAGHAVSGIDVAAGMVTRAQAKAAAAGVDADFEVGDAMTPPWPPATFDVVLSRHVVWALPDPGVGLGRWLDLLAPGGRLVLIEGRWWNGAGLGADDLLAMVHAHGREASVKPLPDPDLWGGPVTDERYVLVSPPNPRRDCRAAWHMELETFSFADDGSIPNSRLPVLVYRGALLSDSGPSAYEDLFAENGWLGAWRDGIYPFHHFHSTSHEVLGIASATANVVLGGPQGRRLQLAAGDVVVLPAGTGHRNCGSEPGLLVVGAYPNGMRWDLRRGDPAEHDEVVANISRVPLAETDPVGGRDGPLVELWSTTA